MNNIDLEFLKKKYGENFAKLCRSLFPSILEHEGTLSNLIIESFAESKSLYEDIVKNNLEDEFKNYVFSKLYNNKKKVALTVKGPFTLMKKAGYTLYECKSNKDVKSFKKYWESEEELCTFYDTGRIKENLIFFAVKDNVESIKREDFKNPRRQDEYGTSVISLQFTKTNPSTLSIKNRYNHTVENPDATFSNNLEKIHTGLTYSFSKTYNLNLGIKEHELEIPGYVLGNDKRFYKYNYEINNIYYCENNIIIDGKRQVHQYDKNKYLLLDYFILDLEKNEITVYDDKISDSFVNEFKNIKKIQVRKENQNKIIEITPQTGENIYITLDKANSIVEYCDANLKYIGDDFLYFNKKLTTFEAPNLESVIDYFLYFNKSLVTFKAPKLQYIGNEFLYSNEDLTAFEAPNLKYIGDDFLCFNKDLTAFKTPNLEFIGNEFLPHNEGLVTFEAPILEEVGDNFLSFNRTLATFEAPNLQETGNYFLWNNKDLTTFQAPNLQKMGRCFAVTNMILTTFEAPKLTEVGDLFLNNNNALTILKTPNLQKVGDLFLCKNQTLTAFKAPKLKEIGDSFLSDNNKIRENILSNIKNDELVM